MTAAAAGFSLAAFLFGVLLAWLLLRRRARVEQTLQPAVPAAPASDQRFDALVRALPLGVVMLDRDLRIRFANRASGAIFGFDNKRIRGVHLIQAVPNIDLENRANGALQGDRPASAMIVAGKNVSRSYAVNVYPLVTEPEGDEDDNAGEVRGVLVLAEDQTEVLALERARQEFLSNVSHELRTPLSSIKLMLETVHESGEEEAQRIFLPQALAQVDRLAALVQRMLEQARADSGKLVLQIEEFDLEEAARPIVASFQPQASARGVNLELRSERPAIVEADRDRIAQIFVNLIDNGLRYTSEGGTVGVTLDVEDGFATIRVSDTGIGIPYRDLPYVFERFYVVDRSRTRTERSGSGAGLGLAIVKQIAEAHGGSVDVESRLGRGTTFTVRIPVVSIPS
ncbi:MAG TPA: ATP-binding protein [Candidatus Baltobacteraceae bacterium]|nr:ATP-binding protein [Candidatus Baltobacteraceae bacterium]